MAVPFADRLVHLCGALALGAVAAYGGPLAGQTAEATRPVVSKSVSVGSDAAALSLEFESGERLEISLDGGRVEIDGDPVAEYARSGPAWDAWRDLLGFAVALDDGPLARALTEWSPPEQLSGEELEVARLLDRTLDEALAAPPQVADAPDTPTPGEVASAPSSPGAGEGGGLTALLGRRDRIPGLVEALDGLDIDELSLTVGEDRAIGPQSDLDATVVVVDGDLEIEGAVRRDVVVVGGDVRLGAGARIEGELRLADGELIRQGGEVEGGVRVIAVPDAPTVDVEELADRIRDEVRSEMRAAGREERNRSRRSNPLGGVFSAIGGIISTLFSILVLGVVGALVTHFAGPNLDAVAETVRRTPGRALVVGTAGSFLLLPVWLIGILVLAVSIIGIPALILWVPLFPVVALLAAGLGYLAAARNVGAWLTRQDYPYTGWVRITNPVTLIMGGALVLSFGYIAAHLVSVLPFTGALEVLLSVTATLLTAVAGLIGFGAVLLTRAGRRPEFHDEDLFGRGGWGAADGWDAPASPENDQGDPWTGAPGGGAATDVETDRVAHHEPESAPDQDAPGEPASGDRAPARPPAADAPENDDDDDDEETDDEETDDENVAGK
jgi:hypothetical protein